MATPAEIARMQQEVELRGRAIANAIQQGLLDEHGQPVPKPPASTPQTTESVPEFAFTIRRPLFNDRRHPQWRYRKLPRRIPVPADVVIYQGEHATITYKNLEVSAAMLYDGAPPTSVAGPDPDTSIVLGAPFARWFLTVLLRYAPDDNARAGSLRAISSIPGALDAGAPGRPASTAVAQCFVQCGRANAYAGAFKRNPAVRRALIDAMTRAGIFDASLFMALHFD